KLFSVSGKKRSDCSQACVPPMGESAHAIGDRHRDPPVLAKRIARLGGAPVILLLGARAKRLRRTDHGRHHTSSAHLCGNCGPSEFLPISIRAVCFRGSTMNSGIGWLDCSESGGLAGVMGFGDIGDLLDNGIFKPIMQMYPLMSQQVRNSG